jgi:hypothetical protein
VCPKALQTSQAAAVGECEFEMPMDMSGLPIRLMIGRNGAMMELTAP